MSLACTLATRARTAVSRSCCATSRRTLACMSSTAYCLPVLLALVTVPLGSRVGEERFSDAPSPPTCPLRESMSTSEFADWPCLDRWASTPGKAAAKLPDVPPVPPAKSEPLCSPAGEIPAGYAVAEELRLCVPVPPVPPGASLLPGSTPSASTFPCGLA